MMIRISNIEEQLVKIFRKNKIKYYCINENHKRISIPIYMIILRILDDKTKDVEKNIKVMVPIFKENPVIYFECYNIFKIDEENYIEVLKVINSLNQYPFPGKFFVEDDKQVTYRCSIDYSNLEKLDDIIIKSYIESIPTAYAMALEEIRKVGENGKQKTRKRL